MDSIENKLLKNVKIQIERLGGIINQSTEDEYRGIKLSKTLKSFMNAIWNSENSFEFWDSYSDDVDISFNIEFIGNGYVKSEPSIDFLSIGYDELNQNYLAMPLFCISMQDPPIYKVNYETQFRLGNPVSFIELLNRLEICQNIKQDLFFEDGLRFSDNNFANAIRKEIHKIDGKITRNDIMNVEKIILMGTGIKNLDGIEIFENLLELTLDNNEIEDVNPMTKLKKIEYISICNNNINDFSLLKNLRSLKILYTQGNPGGGK